jgi:hypothetical protein
VEKDWKNQKPRISDLTVYLTVYLTINIYLEFHKYFFSSPIIH